MVRLALRVTCTLFTEKAIASLTMTGNGLERSRKTQGSTAPWDGLTIYSGKLSGSRDKYPDKTTEPLGYSQACSEPEQKCANTWRSAGQATNRVVCVYKAFQKASTAGLTRP